MEGQIRGRKLRNGGRIETFEERKRGSELISQSLKEGKDGGREEWTRWRKG